MNDVAYLVHRYMDSIKRVENFMKYQSANRYWRLSYIGCANYEEAKRVIVNRAEGEILRLEEEVKKIRKKLNRLKSMTEKAQ